MAMTCYASRRDDGVNPARLDTSTGHAPERVDRRECEEQDAHQGALEAEHVGVDLCTLLAGGREKLRSITEQAWG